MPMVLVWSGLFMFHHESFERKRRSRIEECPLPEVRRACVSQGRLCQRLCQVVGEPAVQRTEYCSEALGIEK
jgi:hypothetical protein